MIVGYPDPDRHRSPPVRPGASTVAARLRWCLRGGALDLDRSTEEACALAHPDKPEPIPYRTEASMPHPSSLISIRRPCPGAGLPPCRGRTPVPKDVGQRLLDDAEGGRADVRIIGLAAPIERQRDWQPASSAADCTSHSIAQRRPSSSRIIGRSSVAMRRRSMIALSATPVRRSTRDAASVESRL